MHPKDLAGILPELMAHHPGHTWALSSDGSGNTEMRVELHPHEDPSRVAAVTVSPNGEVFGLSFAGHSSVAFAYAEEDRRDTLSDRLKLAASATVGPTLVTLEMAGDTLVGSAMVVDPDGHFPMVDMTESRPMNRLRAVLRRQRVERVVSDFPALG